MGDEILEQGEGRVDAFVQSVGTAGSIRGSSEALRRHDSNIRIVAVEPSESAVLSGGPSGAHKIDGVGAGFVVPLWHDGIADQIQRVSTEEAVAMAMRLAREEGLFAGSSTGSNVVAALRLAEQLGPNATIVTLMCGTGMKYLSTAHCCASASIRATDAPGPAADLLYESRRLPRRIGMSSGLCSIKFARRCSANASARGSSARTKKCRLCRPTWSTLPTCL